MAKKEKPISKAKKPKKEPKNISPKIDNSTDLKNQVVSEIKADIIEALKITREDIMKDVHESLEKQKIAAPSVGGLPSMDPSALKGIMTSLGLAPEKQKEFETLFAKLPGTLGNQNNAAAPFAAPGQIPDMSKLTDGQLKYLSTQNQNQMIAQFLPLLMNSQGGGLLGSGGGMMSEIMTRMFIDKLSTGAFMERAFMQQMAKMVGNPKLYQDFTSSQDKMVGGVIGTGAAAPVQTVATPGAPV